MPRRLLQRHLGETCKRDLSAAADIYFDIGGVGEVELLPLPLRRGWDYTSQLEVT